MPDFRVPLSLPNLALPWSGDVTQSINPWTWLFQPVASQFGLVNISLGKSADPQMEETILAEVGSYGRQIGRIGEALAVLIAHTDLGKLTAGERDAIDALRFQLDEIARLKRKQQLRAAA